MPDREEQVGPARPVWRRAAATGRTADSDIVPVCSGEVVSVEQEYERLWALKRQMQREAQEAKEEAEEREATRHPSHHRSSGDDDEDDEKAAERWRNDRYAVKLLRQDESVWAGGGADTGMLG